MVSLLIYFGWIRLPLHSFICILFLILGTACSISETPSSYPIFFSRSFELCSRILYSISSFAHVSKFQVDELFVCFLFFFLCIHAFRLYFWKHQMIFPELKYSVTFFWSSMFWKGHFYFWRSNLRKRICICSVFMQF